MSSVDDSNISQTISEMPPDVSEKGNRIDDNVYLSRETKAPIHKERTPIDIHFLLGGGFNALSMMGPSVSVGLEAGKFLLEADYVVGTEKVEAVGIYYKIPRYYDDSALGEAYDYSASRFSVRLGPIVNMNTSVLAIPQVGVSMNMIKGKELVNELDEDAQFAESNPISAFAAMRLQIKVLKNLCLHITPQYDFSVAPDDVYKVLKEADKKIKSWSEGFSVNAGILLRL
jgi:hypothetical protein